MSLTESQQAAVRREGQDVCVVAGPGSGKTRVLIERFAWLVEERNAPASGILAITFTEKAALEIKQRLIKRFDSRPDLRESIEHAWVSTIHGFCARLLREHAISAGLPPDFTVLDQGPADRLERKAAEDALDQLFVESTGEMRRLMEALDLATDDMGRKPDLARSLLDVCETMRVAGVERLPEPRPGPNVWPRARELAQDALALPQLADWARRFLDLSPAPLTREHFALASEFESVKLPSLGSRSTRAYAAAKELKQEILPQLLMQFAALYYADLAELLRTAIARIATLYLQKKRAQSALDFADLEQQAIHLLESCPEVLSRLRERFEHVLMDELQDTNRLQWRLIDLLRSAFFGVGDINQSIYGFRHADPSLFADYRGGLLARGAVVDVLGENWRSRTEILDAVSQLLQGQAGIEPRPLVAARTFEAAMGPVVERLVGRGDDAADVEAALVASRIRELVDRGEHEYRGIAILVRALGALTPFERALDRFDIPFLVSGGRTFLEAREALDVLALLAALVNPLDEVALVGVLRSPLVGIGDEELYRMGRGWRAEFDRRFGRLRRRAGFLPADRLLATVLDESDYAAGLSVRARANLDKLLAQVRRMQRERARPLAELLEDLEAMRTMQSEAEAPPPDAGNVVRLMTIHAAKGLEFPVVFVSALQRGTDRRRPVIAFSPDAGLGAKWRNPANGKGVSDFTHKTLVDDLKQRESAEENRLLYVAATRAEERLIFSYADRGRNTSPWRKMVDGIVTESTEAEHSPDPPPREASPSVAADAEILMDPPEIFDQHDSSAAVTSVATFHACPRRYYLAHYLGLTEESTRQRTGSGTSGGTELGLEVHKILAGGTSESPEALGLAANFQASDLAKLASRATRIEREFDFLLALDDVILRGQIDLWFEADGELTLVDYKTDREESPEAYALQLRLYALALERYAGRIPDRAVIYYLRSDRAVEVSLEKRELEAAEKIVGEMRRAQQRLEFPLRAGEHCRRCAFFENRCPVSL